jgi:hypothetical protein
MKCSKVTLSIIVCFLAATVGNVRLAAQFNCTGQDALQCDCEQYITYNLTVCLAGQNYPISIDVCSQRASPILINNPCTVPTCDRPVHEVTWVHRICLPTNLRYLPNNQVPALYNAIICATNLCTNNFISANIPVCGPGTACQYTVSAGFCHILALPNCYQWDASGLCMETCDNDCTQYCMVERRYCRDTPTTCTVCNFNICNHPNDQGYCIGDCLDVDCAELSFNACCQ